MDESVTCLRRAIEKVDGKLALVIPLEAGGEQFVQCARGISRLEDGFLKVFIPETIAGVLRIEEGDLVDVTNANGKFNIYPVSPRATQ